MSELRKDDPAVSRFLVPGVILGWSSFVAAKFAYWKWLPNSIEYWSAPASFVLGILAIVLLVPGGKSFKNLVSYVRFPPHEVLEDAEARKAYEWKGLLYFCRLLLLVLCSVQTIIWASIIVNLLRLRAVMQGF